MLFKTYATRIICVIITTVLMFSLAACGDKKVVAPTAPVSKEYKFTGRSVNWEGRSSGHYGSSLNKNGTANLAHIEILSGKNPSIPVSFSLPSEVREVRVLGVLSAPGAMDINAAINNAPCLQSNSYTLNFSDSMLRGNNGTIVLYARGHTVARSARCRSKCRLSDTASYPVQQ